jgi:hypothetical protein
MNNPRSYLAAVAVFFLVASGLLAEQTSAEPSGSAAVFPVALSDSMNSTEAHQILRWLSTLGLPSLDGLPTVKIWTGMTGSSAGEEKEEPIFATGYLVEKTENRIVLLNAVLGREVYTISKRTPGPNHEGEIPYSEYTAPFLGSGSAGLWGFSEAPIPSGAVGSFLMAWCAQQKKRDDLAAKFLENAAEALRSSRGPRTAEALKADFAEYLFQLSILDFADLTLSREQLARKLRIFAGNFPGTPEAGKALVLAEGLDSLIKEEASRSAGLAADASQEERARVLVWKLRDAGNWKDSSNPNEELKALGDAAVPALIAALDDHRPTRIASSIHRKMRSSTRVETIGDYAERILSSLTPGFSSIEQSNRMGTPSPTEPSPQRREYEAWWVEHRAKSAR